MEKRNILIIENDDEQGESIKEYLSEYGYHAYLCKSKLIADELIKREHIDLIIIDPSVALNIKTDTIESNQIDSNILSYPLIFLIDKNLKYSNDIKYESGAYDFIDKPVDKKILFQRIQSYFYKLQKVEKKYEEKMDKLRSDISFALPHEFRTSLSGILGFSQMIMQITKNEDIPNNQQINDIHDMASSIMDAGKQLHRLTENFLYYSQIQTIQDNQDKLKELKNYKIDFTHELIQDVILSHPLYFNRNEDIEYDLDNSSVNISYFNFSKIIYEILDNAIKFSDKGTKIFIQTTTDEKYYNIVIEDHGRGMTQYQLNDIGAYNQFDRYVYEQQGAGLGLIIAKLLVILHDGIFFIESQYGRGTKINIKIPLSYMDD